MISDYPITFWLLFLLVPVGVVLWARYRSGRRELARLGGEWRESSVLNTYVVKWFFSSLAFLAFVLLSVFSLAEIRWGERTVSDEPSGTDVIFAIDISRSMLSIDILPSRLERTALAVKGIMNGLPGSRFGVVIFKGAAIRAVPLTEDVSAVAGFVSGLKVGYITSPGTDIEAGVHQAIESFPRDVESQRFVVLFSDGGATLGDLGAATEHAQDETTTVISIGVGGEKLVPIPLSDGSVVKGPSGETIETKLIEQELELLSKATGGIYLEIRDPTVIGSVVDAVQDLSNKRLLKGFRLITNYRYRLFAFVALLFLLLYQGIRMYRWKGSF